MSKEHSSNHFPEHHFDPFHKFIFGTGDDDVLNGTNGNNILFGFGGDDQIYAKGGKDTAFGGSGNDIVDGGDGNDDLHGGRGNDAVVGGKGNDHLHGDSGNDFLVSGASRDSLYGDHGNDKFVIRPGTGVDTIEDLHANDRVDLRAFNFASAQDVLNGFHQVGHDAVLNLGSGDKLIIENTWLSQLDPAQFIISDTETGPSSSQSPYLIPVDQGANDHTVSFVSLLTAGDQVNGYTMAGTPDGLGAFDNGDGTFTVLMGHEFGTSAGIARDHGGTGSFISELVIDKASLQVLSGQDLIQTVHLYDPNTGTYYDPVTDAGHPVTGAYDFDRLCSADLAPVTAFYNPDSGLGYDGGRIFLNGEEDGPPFSTHYGLAFAHIASGTEEGNSYELAGLGKLSHENVLAHGGTGDKTVVATLDDGPFGTSQVYFYYGDKQSTGSALEKAGLIGGHLFGLHVDEMATDEPTTLNPLGADNESHFKLVDLGDVSNMDGLTLDSISEDNSIGNGVTSFLRPEDGAWDTQNANRFYFVTTDAFNAPTRLWAADFNDVTDPTAGGSIKLLVDSFQTAEDEHMFDNMTVNKDGKVLIQEDPGGNDYNAKVWQYDPVTNQLTQLAEHDPARFEPGGGSFLTNNEEASGIIDVTDILGSAGQSAYLLDVQAHYGIATPGVVEGGQLLVMYHDQV